MSVEISVYGADKSSDEYVSANRLKKIILDSLPESVTGEIVLFASATLMGQSVKDVDLFLIGKLNNYCVKSDFYFEDEHIYDSVEIRNFCTTIEIKSHDISGVEVNGTDFYVRYGNGKHCVTLQSNKQKIAAKNFFEQTISFSPYITNLIWFNQITSKDITNLLTINGKRMPSNVIGAEFTFDELIRLLVDQKTPQKRRTGFVFDCNCDYGSFDSFQNALSLFSRTQKSMGEMTRNRIEMITNKSFVDNYSIDCESGISILRGRAGTGKTVGLIQTAIKMVDEKQARVLILTYNKALVSDIRRLFALADLPDLFEESCVHINTLHSYFYRLCNKTLYDGKMSGDKFLNKYEAVLDELLDFLNDDESIDLIREMMFSDDQLNWDYVLVDEAQDWSIKEKEVILKIYNEKNIIVADGGNQFVRNENACNWADSKNKNSIKLKYCLRQKRNIVSFLNEYSQEMGSLGGKIIPNNKLYGGNVIITSSENIVDICNQELVRIKEAGNIAYDLLCLVPSSMVEKTGGESKFKKYKSFSDAGIELWDGTNSNNRDSYPIDTDEMRVLQYSSARGLEGWTVICLDFDVFIEEKEKEYIDGKVDSLILESPEERKKKYIYNWSMIPFTRAIDTMIITIKNPQSSIAKILKKASEKCPDYVSWIF